MAVEGAEAAGGGAYGYEAAGWREQAEALFFKEHMAVSDIAAAIGRSRKAVSELVNGHDGYDAEMAFRRQVGAARRRAYKREWDRENRADRYAAVTGETLAEEHRVASLILSRECYG